MQNINKNKFAKAVTKNMHKQAAYPFYEMVKDNSPLYQSNDPIGVQSDDNDLNVNFKGVNFDTDFEQAGLFNQYGLSKVDPKELEMGIKVEMEHTTNKEIAKRIALDHLTEISNYYTLLAEMENKAKEQGTFNNNIKESNNKKQMVKKAENIVGSNKYATWLFDHAKNGDIDKMELIEQMLNFMQDVKLEEFMQEFGYMAQYGYKE